MLYIIVVALFVIGYMAIVFEHQIRVNKTATALLTGILTWAVFIVGTPDEDFFRHHDYTKFMIEYAHEQGDNLYRKFEAYQLEHTEMDEDEAIDHFRKYTQDYAEEKGRSNLYHNYVIHKLGHHLIEISQILFFLMGAMTIVELVDGHRGFKIITDRITSTRAVSLLWIISVISFFMSATLDNLTTAIVMSTLLQKLIQSDTQRKYFAGIVVVAANAGGAFSPIGDVTTTMLWIGQYVTTASLITDLFLPSLACMVVPVFVASLMIKGKIARPTEAQMAAAEGNEVGDDHIARNVTWTSSKIMFFTGVLGLVFVPVFKTLTHLPPFMGMMLSLGIIWLVSEIIHSDKDEEDKEKYTAVYALSKIDSSSMLFFLGILLAIGSLQSLHLLSDLAHWADNNIGNYDLIVVLIGLGSAIIDNVPLVAAAMGMYEIDPESALFMQDGKFWQFLAYCAGTGGSALIIGSAAGVAIMGIEKIDFIWYLKKISWLAVIGYAAGIVVYLLQYSLVN